ncbi:sulfotransferase [Paraburkholderia kururiensis]|uniref:Sulfotransferase n=1 Tax=Paraburkholderia kururiensis TaxID=984307 RepID=A0ABZ0WR41_9BURK|nr:tetratricopeptide repeat-containing sulfotransferase family protein [Paraburkholderia kururiensis]WQD79711.1 sulfotransferase [Paraburkholderia kururiensis]
MPTHQPPEELSIPEALSRAHAHWNAGQADRAELLCQRVLAAWPGQADALHLLGLIAHAYGNLDIAIGHLREACKAPRAPAVYSANLAEMCRQKGLLEEAAQAARRAVAMDPTLAAGWNNLGIILQEAGRFDESRTCLEHVIALQPEWAEAHNNLGNTLRRLGRLDLAEPHYRRAIALKPEYPEAHSNLAFLLSSQGRYDEAAQEAQLALDLNPRFVEAYLNLAEVESVRHRYDAALRVFDKLQAFAPQHPVALVAYAKLLLKLERDNEALVLARRAVACAPQYAEAHNMLATVLQARGETDEALAAFERAAQLPGTVAEEAMLGRAMVLIEAGRKDEALAAFDRALEAFPGSALIRAARADTRTFEAGDPDFPVLEAFVAQDDRRALEDRIAVQFALGKAYLDIKDSARAFAHFDAANRARRASFAYDQQDTERWLQRIAETFTPELYERLQGMGAASDLPVFIVGMPRSGTTLIEQIVAAHPDVTGAGELAALRQVVDASGVYPDRLPALAAGPRYTASRVLEQLGRDYLARTLPLARGSVRLVDKMPGNFALAGLIPLILPGARIIHTRRDAVDTCLSCYTKLFAGDQPFAYDQAELGRFYRAYERLMAHWRAVLPPGQFIEVDYEAVVDNVEYEARRLIEFLGLPWSEACLNFHQDRRVVRTASANQVRQPIYGTSKGRWRAHTAYLGPLLAALGVEMPQ